MALKTISVSLPESVVALVDRTAKKEHRTRSALVREALQGYLRVIPVVTPTKEEKSALRRGKAEIRRGEFVTLEALRHELASRSRQKRKQSA